MRKLILSRYANLRSRRRGLESVIATSMGFCIALRGSKGSACRVLSLPVSFTSCEAAPLDCMSKMTGNFECDQCW